MGEEWCFVKTSVSHKSDDFFLDGEPDIRYMDIRMGTLTHKTTILLAPEEHRFLVQEARKAQTTMGALIRRAIRKLYLSPPRDRNIKIWEKLFRLKAPTADWDQMEAEILKGRLNS